LLVDARTARAQQIAQMGDARRVATLSAFAAIGELRAQDQTLDHLEVILSEIDGRATARERKRRLEIAGLIDQAGVRLADACALVLDESINDADLRPAILARVGRGRLEEAISQLREHTRPVEEGTASGCSAATGPCADSCRCCWTRSTSRQRTLASTCSKRSERCKRSTASIR
jgi:hypothetical protein